MNLQNSKTRKDFIILSAELADSNSTVNDCKTESLRGILGRSGLAFKEIEGCYKDSREVSFLVEFDTKEERNLIKSFSWLYNQESFLLVNGKREATLIYNNRDRQNEDLGTFRGVSMVEALQCESYSYCALLDTYFTCK